MTQVNNGTQIEQRNRFDPIPNGEDDAIDISKYFRVLLKAKWFILASIILCLVVGRYFSMQMTPLYQASVKILADPQKPTATLGERAINNNMISLFYQTQYEIISSRNVALAAVDKLELVDKYKNKVSVPSTKTVIKTSFIAFLDDIGLSSVFNENEEQASVEEIDDVNLRISLASMIQANLDVTGGKQSQIINIKYISTDPQEAADVVNAIAESYIQFGLETRLIEVRNTEKWLSEQAELLKANLRESEARISDYRSKQGLIDSDQQQDLINNQLRTLNNKLIDARTQLSSLQEQYQAVQKVDLGSAEIFSLGSVLRNPATRDLVRERGRLVQRVNELNERYGEKHPTMIAARSELKTVTENLDSEVSKVVDNIEEQYQLAKLQVENIQKLIDETKTNVQLLQTENFSLESLERDVENNRRIYDNFQVSLLEASVIRDYTGSNVSIIDSATVPEVPFSPNTKLMLVISIVFGAGLGATIIFLKELLDNTFKTPDDTERKLSVTPLGITPHSKSGKTNGPPEKEYLRDSLTSFSESISTIRTGLLFSNIESPPKTILVTSANSGEGKSTLAINLAAAFSNLGKTLLLEVDLRKPSIAGTLNIELKQGLTDLLSEDVKDKNDIMHFENDGKLSVICCGTMIRNPLELISSVKFESLVNTFKQEYDYIILDGPPSLPVSDSHILSSKVDGTIFAIAARKTKVRSAKSAILSLKQHSANLIGTVLTNADLSQMSVYGDHFDSGDFYGLKPNKPKKRFWKLFGA